MMTTDTSTMQSRANDPGAAEASRQFAREYFEHSGDPIVGKLLGELDERDAHLEQLRRDNVHRDVVDEYRDAKDFEIQANHYQRVEQALGEAEAAAEDLAQAWEAETLRRPEQTALQEKRAEAALEAMTTGEAEQLAERYLEGGAVLTYHSLNVLSIVLKNAGSAKHAELRAGMSARNASQQWRQLPAGKPMGERLNLLQKMRGGNLAYQLEGDPSALQSIPIAKLLNKR